MAACLTPTDPILAAAVVGGKYAEKHVPVHIRHLLAAECGCNDGAAFPFLFISLYLTTNATVGDAIEQWFLDLWLCELPLNVQSAHLLITAVHFTFSSASTRSNNTFYSLWFYPRLRFPPSHEVLRE